MVPLRSYYDGIKHCTLFTGVQCLPPDLVGDSKPGKAEDSDQLSSSEEGSDKQDAEQQLPPACLLYTSPSPRDATLSRMPSSA